MPEPFISPDFLLTNDTARRLYHEVAAPLPIIDYHCHLSPHDLARNRQFTNLYEIWLEGDHYKWRALRSNGVSEELITGSATPREKYQAWAETMPYTWRNPLFHWSQLELSRYFGIDALLDADNAEEIWNLAGKILATPELTAHGILEKFQVEFVGTTDDPVDSLEAHASIAASGISTRVVPTYRPDKATNFSDLDTWNGWVDQLQVVGKLAIRNYDDFLTALHGRHDYFGSLGCRLTDHGLVQAPGLTGTQHELSDTFREARAGKLPSPEAAERFAGSVLREVGRWNAEKNWTMQLHLGAQRNNNTRMLQKLGRDTGFDSIGDTPQADKLARFLDSLAVTGQLPKTIIYNLNPADNYLFATMIGNFNEGPTPGKVQFGSGWWFLDQKEGIEWQLNAVSQLGLLSRFVGMTTDSRSFLSYPRHEYFRRILCNMLGQDAESGLIPQDWKTLSRYVADISYHNARKAFQFD